MTVSTTPGLLAAQSTNSSAGASSSSSAGGKVVSIEEADPGSSGFENSFINIFHLVSEESSSEVFPKNDAYDADDRPLLPGGQAPPGAALAVNGESDNAWLRHTSRGLDGTQWAGLAGGAAGTGRWQTQTQTLTQTRDVGEGLDALDIKLTGTQGDPSTRLAGFEGLPSGISHDPSNQVIGNSDTMTADRSGLPGEEGAFRWGGNVLPPGFSVGGLEFSEAQRLAGKTTGLAAVMMTDADAMHQRAFKAVDGRAISVVEPAPITASGLGLNTLGQPGPELALAGFGPVVRHTLSTTTTDTPLPVSMPSTSDSALSVAEVDPLQSELMRMTPLAAAGDKLAVQPTVAIPLQRFTGAPGWDQGLGQRILWMVEQGMNQAELRLDPPQLGSVTVRITVSDDQAQLMFQAQHPAAREALESALPKLRDMFAEQGLELGDTDISGQNDSDGSSDSSGDEPGLASQHGTAEGPQDGRLRNESNGITDSSPSKGIYRGEVPGLIDEFV